MIKKFKILAFFISLSLCLCLMSSTYSRYVADTTGDLEIMFSKWQILVNDNDITKNTNSSILLVPVIEENENIQSNTLAPSSKGYFDIVIDPTNVNVSFNYSIGLDLQNNDLPDLLITKYSILESTYNDGDEVVENTIENSNIEGTLNFDNKISNFKFNKFTIRVYFEWYDGADNQMDDETDTKAMVNNDNAPFKVQANIQFTQKTK